MNPASPGSAVKDSRTTMATSSKTKITEWRRVTEQWGALPQLSGLLQWTRRPLWSELGLLRGEEGDGNTPSSKYNERVDGGGANRNLTP
jgi:hypothetical protein